MAHPVTDSTIPSGTRLLEILGDLGVAGADLDEALRHRPGLDARDDLTHAVQSSTRELLSGLGTLGEWSTPDLSAATDPLLRWFWLYVFAGAYDTVRAWHADRGIDPDVSRRTLADVARHVQHTRRRHGQGGLALNQEWLSLHFRGSIYQLGRLQFELVRVGRTTSREIQTDGGTANHGDPAIGVHIPDYCGPFTPEQVAESFDLARAFFPRHFPEHAATLFLCHSWLLDPELTAALSPSSNIVSFAQRFTVHRRPEPNDQDAVTALFGVPTLDDLDALPRTSSIQRVLLDRLTAGGHWHLGAGWAPIDAP